MSENLYAKSISEVFSEFGSNERGLTNEVAEQRLKEFGQNKLPEVKALNPILVFLQQFQSPLIYVLFAASVVVFLMGDIVDGSIILFVLLFNAIVGTVQEGKAQNTLLALKKFVETRAIVLRDSKEVIIPDYEIVPGDVLILQEGERVSADVRVIVSRNLKIDESVLTGESEPTHKISGTLNKIDSSMLGFRNIVFKGTNVVAGNGRGLVIATGLKTTIGKISKKIIGFDTEIPLKTDIRNLSRFIIIAVAGISIALFSFGVIFGRSVREMFTTVVSLSVSIIPEGLPIVITLALATGVWRMSKRNVLVKKLQAVEALGQARVIAVDKTGTLTKNELIVERIYVDDLFLDISGSGYEPNGDVSLNGSVVDSPNHLEVLLVGKISALCADARVVFSEEDKVWRVSGDPTEAAMLVFSKKLGFHREDLERENPIVSEMPFNYKLKYHASIYKSDNENVLVLAGAPEVVLGFSERVWRGGKSYQFGSDEREKLESIFLKMSEDGFRVVALAERRGVSESLNLEDDLRELVFVGFLGMRDSLRPEACDAMRQAQAAGIRVVMITGDHSVVAKAIGKQVGIYNDGDEILSGRDIENLSVDELSKKIGKVSIFSRVTPEHKLKIIQAYKARGEIVAMTGDGVNDAPSLVAADLGVAMGKIGTEVAKEAADIVLLDDNFGSIIFAVEEGRSIYKTIKKVILYLFSTSLGETLAIVGSLLIGFPLPILPAQIIWLNLVTDGFLDVSLAMEPKEKGLLRGTFERSKKYLVDSLMIRRMIFMALPMALGSLFLFSKFFNTNIEKAWTISLTTLAVFQWFNAWNCRSDKESIFRTGFFSNKYLLGATLIVISLQIFAIYNPLMQRFLRTVPLSLNDWFIIVPIAFSIILVEEARKVFYRRRFAA